MCVYIRDAAICQKQPVNTTPCTHHVLTHRCLHTDLVISVCASTSSSQFNLTPFLGLVLMAIYKQHIKNLRASVQNPKSRQLRKSQVRVIHAIQNKSVTVDGSTIYNFIIQGKDQKYQRANIFSSTIYIKFKVTKFM